MSTDFNVSCMLVFNIASPFKLGNVSFHVIAGLFRAISTDCYLNYQNQIVRADCELYSNNVTLSSND